MRDATTTWREWCSDKQLQVADRPAVATGDVTPEVGIERAIASVWRIQMRAKRDRAPDSVLIACERAIEDLEAAGYRFETYVGEPYSEHSRMHVVEHEGGDLNRVVVECVSPAVFYHNKLVSKAHVITKGTE